MKITITIFLLSTIILFSCAKDNKDKGISDKTEIANLMNEKMELPAGSFTIDPDNVEIDNSITITPTSGITPLSPGQQMNNQISFTAPNGKVNAVGMRFGTSGPIYFTSINTNGATSGTGTVPFSLESDICNDLSSICHDIKCYEFAMTTEGKISKSNIRDVAILCGDCNEPSCQGLVDASDCDVGGSGVVSSFSITDGTGLVTDVTTSCTYTPPPVGGGFNDAISLRDDNSGSFLSIANVGTSGTYTFVEHGGGDVTIPQIGFIAYSDPSDFNTSYYPYSQITGTGSWSGNTFTVSGTMEDYNNSNTYNFTATVVCD